MSDVFVSYAREDRDLVQRLADGLASQGLSIWWDREMVAGDDINEAIEHELSIAKCVIVVWSKVSVRSPWVRGEAEQGRDRDVLLPVSIADVVPPLPFGEIHTVNLTGWKGDATAAEFESLLKGIRKKCHSDTEPRPHQPPDTQKLARQRRSVSVLASLVATVTIGAALAFALSHVNWADRGDARPESPKAADASNQSPASPIAGAALMLRRDGALVSTQAFEVMLVQRGFYDLRRNPSGKGIGHLYEPVAVGDAVLVRDAATGLLWQKNGLGDDLADHDKAERMIKELNAKTYGGFSDWRLPTLEEAMSLMEAQEIDFGELKCRFDPVLGRGRFFVWTSDLAAQDRGWVAYYCDGSASIKSISSNAYIRAVRSERVGSTAEAQTSQHLPPLPEKRLVCRQADADEEVKELGHIEAVDEPDEEVYRFVVCDRHNRTDGTSQVCIQDSPSSAFGIGNVAQIVATLIKKHLECGERSVVEHKELTLRLCQRNGKPVSLELLVATHHADGTPKDPQRLAVDWPLNSNSTGGLQTWAASN